jgi:gliding motility-associated-like protein
MAMKKILLFFLLIALSPLAHSQAPFWTETFGVGCSQNQTLTPTSPIGTGNGNWNATYLSGYLPTTGSDEFFISATEAGMLPGQCGNGCIAAPALTNRSLHIGNSSSSLTFLCTSGDCGAIYNAGIFSDIRAESPNISTIAQNNIVLSFNYLENGQGTFDDGTVYYRVGAGAWTLAGNPAKTLCGNAICSVTNAACTGLNQGVWSTYSVNLPAATWNQPAIQVGFRWVNNGDNTGTDPSYAIDEVKLTAPNTFTPSFTLTSPVCSGSTQNATLSISPATLTAAGYTWSASPAGPTFSAPNASVTSITFPTAGAFTISCSASVAAQGVSTANQTITVVATPTLVPTAFPATVCVGSSSTLTALGATTYTWLPMGTVSQSVSVTPFVNTTYSVIGANGTCTSIATVSVATIPPLNVTTSSTSQTVCPGGSATITASGATTYTWAPDPSLSTTSGSVVVASPTVATTYTVVGQTGSCGGATVVTIGMGTTLNLTLTPTSAVVCPGGSATLTANGASSYTWTPSSSLSSSSGAVVTASPSVNTAYTVFGASGTCTGQATSNITIGPPIPISISASPAFTVCPGGSTTLTAVGANNYTWSPTLGLSASTGSAVVASPSVNTNYSVIGTNTAGCTGSATVSVNMGPPLTVTVSPSTATTCIGGNPVNLTAFGGTNYIWSPSTSLNTNTGAAVIASPSTTTQYTVLGSTGTCTGQAVATVSVLAQPVLTVTPTNTVICYGTAYTYTANGALSYTWAVPTPSASIFVTPLDTLYKMVSLSPTVTTSYTITGETAQGCLSLSKVVTLTVVPIPTATVSLVTNTLGVPTNTICGNSTATLSVGTSTLPLGMSYTYTWSPTTNNLMVTTPTSSMTTTTPSMTACNSNSLVTYTATVYYTQLPNCKVQDTATLRVINCFPPVGTFTTFPKLDTICEKQCIVFQNTSCGGKPQLATWYIPGGVFPGGVPDSTTSASPVTVCFPVAPFDYTVSMVVTNPYGKDSIYKNSYVHVVDTPDAVIASAHLYANRDTCIRFGSKVQLHALNLGSGTYVAWTPSVNIDCAYCPDPIVSPSVTTNYVVTAYNSKKCKFSDTVQVCVVFDCGEMFVPNAFSPNDDLVNDVLYVRGKCLSNFIFQIFNRWGEKVFESTKQELGWDGTYNDEPMNTGVFVYRLEGTTFDNQPYSMKGNVTLIR